jgi:hypothetical protein
MRRFIEINDSRDVSEEKIAELIDSFEIEPFNFGATLDDDDVLIVENTELGLVVTTIDMILADHSLADEVVEVMMGGQTTSWHRRCIVSHEVAVPAVTRFLRHRDTPADLGWISGATMTEWEAAHRKPPLSGDAILELWMAGDRIGAVREYRRAHGLGLKEALDVLQSLTGCK